MVTWGAMATTGVPTAIAGIRKKLGLDAPVIVQYARFIWGLVAGRDYANGADVTHCAAPCFGYSFKTEQPVWPLLTDRFGRWEDAVISRASFSN